MYIQGTWVAQSVKPPILDFGSGHKLRVMRSGRTLGSAMSVQPVWDSFSPPSASPIPAFSTKKEGKKSVFLLPTSPLKRAQIIRFLYAPNNSSPYNLQHWCLPITQISRLFSLGPKECSVAINVCRNGQEKNPFFPIRQLLFFFFF